ncbi:hypothetical protein B9Z55_028155 [Caenorhabditis nigoni]|nr:hypothetical protein B9Z55_028155 [Caenorhabditis nigoni]
MEDDLEVGDIRLGEEGYFDDFGASTSHQPVEAKDLKLAKLIGWMIREEPEVAEGHDEYEDTDDDKDVRDERRIGGLPPWVVRNEYFDDFGASAVRFARRGVSDAKIN